ncbi:MAG: filamentous hemagglutinin N-terminal domain-containing protein [Microcoleaceae cyanobacterium]
MTSRVNFQLFLRNVLQISNVRVLILSSYFWVSPAIAQIVPDSTLPNHSVIVPSGSLNEIVGGTTAGSNLFHSFEQFSVPTGTTAFFNNAGSIANIISRVTGGSVSSIDGLIRANGTANLFLLNPNGIIFGPNAALQIGGSFVGSTAEEMQFADGLEFSAINPQASPLLSVNIPIGLQYGAIPGDITVQGPGNNLTFNFDVGTIVRDDRPLGLQVPPGQTLALVGGNILLPGGNLTAEDGQVVLGSVSSGTVSLVPADTDSGWSFNYAGVQTFQDILLSDTASIDTSGNGGGRVQIQGRQVVVSGGSAVLANTLGTTTGGDINIKASEVFAVAGTTPTVTFPSLLSTNVDPGAIGQGGNIQIDTGSLILAGGGRLQGDTFGSGDAGNISIRAGEINISGGTAGLGSSGISTSTLALGQGGDVQIQADRLSISGGALVFTGTLGSGNGGNLTVQATDVELLGTSPSGGVQSGLFSNVLPGATGQGGNVTIEAIRFRAADGAQATALTLGNGDAGNLTIDAAIIEVIGVGQRGGSALLTTVESGATTGNGGNLTLNAGQLSVRDGGQIGVGTASTGQGGDLTVRAAQVDLRGSSEFGRSGLFSNAIESTGNGGTITVNANQLSIQDGATINASNFPSLDTSRPPGEGQAGSVTIQANTVLLGTTDRNNPSSITATTFNGGGGNITLNIRDGAIATTNSQISAETRGSGKGGNVMLRTSNLTVDSGASLSTSTLASGSAGLIDLNANSVNVNTGGRVLSESLVGATGNSGNINLNALTLNLLSGGLLSTSTASSGNAGNLYINTTSTRVDQSSRILSESLASATGAGGNLNLATNILNLINGGILSTSTLGVGDAGNAIVNANTITIDGSSPATASGIFSGTDSQSSGQGGQITLNTNTLNLVNGGVVNTNTESSGRAGNITIFANTANLDGGGGVLSEARIGSTGAGGSVGLEINSSLNLTNNGQVSTNSQGLGEAGNINISARTIQMNQGEVTATSMESGGGDINLTTDFLGLNNNSLVSTSVSDSTGGGGDVRINSDFVVAQGNSDIRANAVLGPGGNITISTQGIFLVDGSEITASSQFGVDGVVNVSNPDTNRQVATTQLPEQVTDVSQLVVTGCASEQQNTFVVTGRGGLPEDPRQTLGGEVVWSDLRTDLRDAQPAQVEQAETSDAARGKIASTLVQAVAVEAQAWIVNKQGNLELVAHLPNQTNPRTPILQPLYCYHP